jgi:Zn/Cd-binding protein ZinT
MGKNKNMDEKSVQLKEKTQELEETKRISKGYFKNNPTKSK